MTTSGDPRALARKLAHEALERDDPTGWFERLYAAGGPEGTNVPWVDFQSNPLLDDWPRLDEAASRGGRALIVGCGFGDDAEAIARRGPSLSVTAFDIAPTAIACCRARFPASRVEYMVANLFAPPAHWADAFDLVCEAYTIQALPPGPVRARAIAAIAALVAPAGGLYLVARGRSPEEPAGTLPWPLTREEVGGFAQHGLVVESFEDRVDATQTRRFRAVLARPA